LKTGHAHPDVSHEPKTGPEFEESSSKLTQIYSLYDQGTNQRILGDPQGALAHLRQAASLARAYYSRGYNNKNSSLEQVIHYDLGQAAEKARDLDQALEAYLYCLQLSPGNLDAAGRVVSILVQKGQLQAALRVAQNAVSAHPEDARARAFLAGVLTKMGNGTEASQEAEKSSQILKDTGELSPDETGSRESDPTKPKSEEPTPGL